MTHPDVIDAEATEIGSAVAVREVAPVNLFRAADPGEVIVKATATAKPLAEVIRKQKLYKTIQGKNHVLVEGWTLLGSMLGVFPIVQWTRKLDNGWEARVEARTMDGNVVGAAEAQCLRTETRWASADDYAIRSMAQTRATSRALRGPLGFVVQLAGFQPEPAEDMPESAPAKKPESAPAKKTRKSAGEPAEPGSVSTGRAAPTDAGSAPADAASPAEGSGASSPDDTHRSSAPESPFKQPTGPRGSKDKALEANELAAELGALVNELGATDSLPMVESKREAGDTAWLKRQITTARKSLERRAGEQETLA